MITQATSTTFWRHRCHLVFTSSTTQTAEFLKVIGQELDASVSSHGMTVDELNQESNRQARKTKKKQLSKMLQCIHGMLPFYAKRLAEQFGTFSNMKKQLNRNPTLLPEDLSKSLRKAITVFFQTV